MSSLTQETQDAYLAGANFTMGDSFTLFGAICIGLVILLVAYIILCLLKGLGDDSVKLIDVPSLIIRSIVIILVISCFLFFQ